MKDLADILFPLFPDARYASGKTEIVLRCRYCGDSVKDPRAAHFYIKNIDGQPHLYNCFKCGEKGIFSAKTLRDFSVYDTEAAVALETYNKSVMSNPQYKSLMRNKTYKVYNNFISNNELTHAKINYINRRLGINLTIEDCLRLKIVPNLHDLLNANYISKFTRHPNIVQEFTNSFIGFLSIDNSFVVLRNLRSGKVYKGIDKRYQNYNIFGKLENAKRFYTIPTQVNTLDPTPIHIHIAEGVFDILSIYFNLRNQANYQNIYSTIGGNQYLNQVKTFLTEYGLFNSIFHLYIDNDVPEYKINIVEKTLRPLKIPLYIHWNEYTGEKDFGVKPSNIIEHVQVVIPPT